MRNLRVFVLIGFASFMPAFSEGATSESVPLVSHGRSDCAIYCEQTDGLSTRSAARLAQVLAEQAGSRPPVFGSMGLETSGSYTTRIIIDGSRDRSLLSKVNGTVEVPNDRADAYALKVIRQGSGWIVVAAGNSPAGAKYAVYRLIEEMHIDGQSAMVRPLDLRASPFIATRSVSLFNIWRVPVDVIRQCNLESWPIEKIQRSIDTYDAFGFNAIETHDRFHEGFLKTVYGITRPEWRDKVYAMCDRAHANGMSVFLRLWGNSVANPVTELKGGYTPFGFKNLAPDIPGERKQWETEIRDYAATNYASHIDHLIGHWADAGGVHEGSHATVRDSMLLHNELVGAFRSINPTIQSSFNLWGMANPRGIRGWPGYIDHKSICDSGVLPRDVAIAQTTRSHSHPYLERVTSDILNSGHPAAVWSWRRGDNEVRLGDAGLRIRIHDLVGEYFANLPASARQLSWHNIERNHHGLANDVNYYIAGKLMWDPHTDVDQALNRYCQLVFGERNAAAVTEAYNTIEVSRDVENENRDDMIAKSSAGGHRASAALEAIGKVKLPAGHHSRLPSVTSPQEMLDQIRGTLAAIAENGRVVSEKLPALDKLLQTGKADEAKALIAELQGIADSRYGTVAGGVEGLWLREALKARTVGVSTTGSLGFQLRNVESMQSVEDGYAVRAVAGKEPAIAVRQLEKPASGLVEFRFRAKTLQSDGSRNGGLVFSASKAQRDLVRCQFYLGGKFLRIQGEGAVPARVDAPSLDPSAVHECVVAIDPSAETISFRVDGYALKTKLKADGPIVSYGYIVENSATQFSNIEMIE